MIASSVQKMRIEVLVSNINIIAKLKKRESKEPTKNSREDSMRKTRSCFANHTEERIFPYIWSFFKIDV